MSEVTSIGKEIKDAAVAASLPSGAPHRLSKVEQQEQAVLATVARNSAFVLGIQMLLKILAFLFNIYVVRRLGAVHFGRYAAVMAYVTIFAIFTDWGMSPYAVREMAQDRRKTAELLPNIIAIRGMLSLVIIVIAPLSALWLGKEGDMVWGILIASVGLLLYAFQGPLDSALTARERLDYTSTFGLINQLVFWGLGVLLLMSGIGFIGLVIASLVGVAVAGLLSGWTLFRLGVGKLTLTVHHWPQLLLAALPFGVSGIAYVFMQRFDTVLMSFILTDAAVGWYNVPWTLLNMVLLIAQSIAIAMYPSLVRSHKESPESLPRVVWKSIKYLLIVCLPIVVGGTVLAHRIIITLYEDTFFNSIPVLQMVLWALPSLFLLELLGRVANTLHLERPAARINVINAAITVLLNLILVPVWGILGAALALVAGRTIRLAQYWHLIGNERLVGRHRDAVWRIVASVVVMGVVVYLAESALARLPAFAAADSWQGLLALIGIGALTYLVTLLASGGLERQEIAFLRRMVTARWVRSDTR